MMVRIFLFLLIFNAVLFGRMALAADFSGTGKATLAPPLAIDSFPLQTALTDAAGTSVRAEFILHVRPFALLCEIARLIHEQEGITIFLSARSKDGRQSFTFERPLSGIRNYGKVLAGFYHIFGGSVHGVIRIKNPHRFYLRFVDKNSQPCCPVNIALFLENFLSNRLRRTDGSHLDVTFQGLLTEDLKGLPSTDMRQIKYLLGYAPKPKIEDKPKPKVAVKKRVFEPGTRERFSPEMLRMMQDEFLPDYKGFGRETEQMAVFGQAV